MNSPAPFRVPVTLTAPLKAWAVGSPLPRSLSGAGATPAGIVAVDDARVELGHVIVAEAEALHRPPLHVLGVDVGLFEQP